MFFSPKNSNNTFSHFVPKSPSQALLAHSTSNINLWHEQFCHIDFRSLQQLSSKHMVKGLPNINFSKGECSTCSVDMNLKEKYEKENLLELQLFFNLFTWY